MLGMPRNGTTCRNCQAGHQKCVKDSDSDNCRRCQQRGVVCLHDAQLRVRNVVSVSQKNAQGKRKKRSLKYRDDQVWVPVPRTLDFAPLEQPGEQTHQTQQAEGDLVVDTSPPTQYEEQDDQFQSTTTSPSIARSDFAVQHDHSPDYCSASSSIAPHSVFVPESQPESIIPSVDNFWPFHDSHEAHLFLHYVQRLSSWLDAMDSNRHFGTDVARRASHVPVIMNAILASSSRHIAFMSGTEDTNSAAYHDECLRILIPVLDDPLDVLDENLFAAIIILRQYEEFDERDERCHLFGSTRMVDSVVNSSTYTSLRQAANWVALRQEIYVSLTNRQPVSIMLDAYRDSSYFHSDTEDAWANRMVFIFAKVLNYAFKPPDSVPEESWSELYDQVEAWNSTKPRYFVPLWSETTSTQIPSAFPRIIMLGPSQVNGMQHYCLARILLATYDPRLSKLGFDTQKARKKSEETMLHFLRMVIGLATSNPHVESSFMHVSHILSACGHYFSDQYEREAACNVLRDIEQRGIWRTASIIAQLQDQWSSE